MPFDLMTVNTEAVDLLTLPCDAFDTRNVPPVAELRIRRAEWGVFIAQTTDVDWPVDFTGWTSVNFRVMGLHPAGYDYVLYWPGVDHKIVPPLMVERMEELIRRYRRGEILPPGAYRPERRNRSTQRPRRQVLHGRDVTVVGLPYHHADTFLNKLHNGRILELIREPSNPHDANAIGVWLKEGGTLAKIGFIQREYAKKVAPVIDRGAKVSFVIQGMGINQLQVAKGSLVGELIEDD